MDRNDFSWQFDQVRRRRPVEGKIQGSYLGEYLESARQNLDEDEIPEFIVSLIVDVKHGYSDIIFNQDQKYRFIRWLEEKEHVLIDAYLYYIYGQEQLVANSIASPNECIMRLETLKGRLLKCEDREIILFLVENLPRLLAIYEVQINEYLEGADPYKDGDKIIVLSSAANKYSGKITSKLLRSIKSFTTGNITQAQSVYKILCNQYGKRELSYLNLLGAIGNGAITRPKEDRIRLKFVLALLEGRIRPEEKQLLERSYEWRFDRKIEGCTCVRDYLKVRYNLSSELTELEYEDWSVFYEIEKEVSEDEIDICIPVLVFFPINSPLKWQRLSEKEKRTLMIKVLYDNLKKDCLNAYDIKEYDEFCQKYEKKRLKEIVELASINESPNVMAMLVEKGFYSLPTPKEIKDNKLDTPVWLKNYTARPKNHKAGNWVLDYYEIYGNSPQWFQSSQIDNLLHEWLLKESDIFRQKYFLMYLDSVMLNKPKQFSDLINAIFFGNRNGENLDIRKFMSESDLRKFVAFLKNDGILPDGNDTLIQYLMSEREYAEYIKSKEDLEAIASLRKCIHNHLISWLNMEGDFVCFQYVKFSYSDQELNQLIFNEIVKNVGFSCLKMQLKFDKDIINFVKKTVAALEYLIADDQTSILLEMTKSVLEMQEGVV